MSSGSETPDKSMKQHCMERPPIPPVAAAFGVVRSDDKSVQEDLPTLRSVPRRTDGNSPSLMAYGGLPQLPGGPLGLSPLRGGLGQMKGGTAQLVQPLSEQPSKETPKEESAKWRVPNNLEPLPSDFILERTSRKIPAVDASEVSSRISDILRIRSVATVFDDDKAKAKCRTDRSVCFRIRLYAAPDVAGVIVELQRRRGSSVSFMKECRAIFTAAEGDAPSQPTDEPPIPNARLVSEMNCLKEAQVEAVDASSALETITRLLSGNRHDSKLLALEGLKALTDTQKTSINTAIVASDAVIRKQSPTEIVLDVLTSPAKVTSEDDHENDYQERLRNNALATLLNAVTTLDNSEKLHSALDFGKDWINDDIIPALIRDIRNAEHRPHHAALAARCLGKIIRVYPLARHRAREEDAISALELAHTRGVQSHLSLANDATETLATLRNAH